MKWAWFKRKRESMVSSPTGLREQDFLNALKEAQEELLAAHAKNEEYKWLENALCKRTWEYKIVQKLKRKIWKIGNM